MLDVLLIVVIGGMGTIYGAVVGSVLLVLAQNYLQDLMKLGESAVQGVPVLAQIVSPDRWLLWLGILFVLSVLLLPERRGGPAASARRAQGRRVAGAFAAPMNRHGPRWPSPAATIAAAFAALLLVASGAVLAAGDDASPWPTAGWEVSTPEAQGVASSALAELVDFGAANGMDSLLVVRHGRIVAEAYYAPFRPGMRHLVNSVTKAVVGTLAGIAVQSGEIAQRRRAGARVVPLAHGRRRRGRQGAAQDRSPARHDLGPRLERAARRRRRPRRCSQMERSRDWVGFVLDRPMAHRPAPTFNYNSGDWHLLSAILSRKTGMDTLAYARRTLFGPLGITDATWRSDPQGIRTGGYGLSLQPRDMAKIGYLYLHRGRWAGQRIVPAAWIDRVFRASLDMGLGTTPRFHYAGGWWTLPDRRAYLAVGFQRQLIIVLPDVGSGRRRHGQAQLSVPSADRSPRRSRGGDDGASCRRRRQRPAYRSRRRDAAIEKATPVGPASAAGGDDLGQIWRFDRNPLGLRSLMLDLTASEPRFRADYEGSAEARRRADRRADRPRRPLAQPRGRRPAARRQGTLARAPTPWSSSRTR